MFMICVYYLNERDIHVRMAMNSLHMLRAHNQSVPIRLFIVSNEFVPKHKHTEELLKWCKEWRVEVVQKPLDHEFFFTNKHHIKDCPENRVLFIDADTFIFDDVEKIFDKYQDCDFVGCKNEWVTGRGWDDFLDGVMPFNGGVQLYNNGCHRNILGQLPSKCNDLGAMGKWLKEGDMEHNREEMAISKIVAEEHSFEYFRREDCLIPLWSSDLDNPQETIIFHSFVSQWNQIYSMVESKK